MTSQSRNGRLSDSLFTSKLCRSRAPAQSVRQWRLDPEHKNYRPPSAHWQRRFLPIARKRGRELEQLAAELERAARQ